MARTKSERIRCPFGDGTFSVKYIHAHFKDKHPDAIPPIPDGRKRLERGWITQVLVPSMNGNKAQSNDEYCIVVQSPEIVLQDILEPTFKFMFAEDIVTNLLRVIYPDGMMPIDMLDDVRQFSIQTQQFLDVIELK